MVDAVLNGYLAKLAGRINERAQSPFPLSIDVTRDTRRRLVAGLPGGFLRMPLGAVAEAATEQDLAFALAHGIAHVVARLGIYTGMASIPLVFPGHMHEDGFLLPQGMIARYRKNEEQADALAQSWVTDLEPDSEFEAARQRARELVQALTPRPSRKGPPTLRRK